MTIRAGNRTLKERSDFKAAVWQDVAAKSSGVCFYCGESGVDHQIDHFVPRSRGGLDHVDNLVASCPACNMGKSSHLIDEYRLRVRYQAAKLPYMPAFSMQQLRFLLLHKFKDVLDLPGHLFWFEQHRISRPCHCASALLCAIIEALKVKSVSQLSSLGGIEIVKWRNIEWSLIRNFTSYQQVMGTSFASDTAMMIWNRGRQELFDLSIIEIFGGNAVKVNLRNVENHLSDVAIDPSAPSESVDIVL